MGNNPKPSGFCTMSKSSHGNKSKLIFQQILAEPHKTFGYNKHKHKNLNSDSSYSNNLSMMSISLATEMQEMQDENCLLGEDLSKISPRYWKTWD